MRAVDFRESMMRRFAKNDVIRYIEGQGSHKYYCAVVTEKSSGIEINFKEGSALKHFH